MWSKIMLNPKKDDLENGFLKPEYPFKIQLNRCVAQLSSCSDYVQQTGLAQKDIPVVVLIAMALIATRDFHRVSSKRIGEIVNSCINDLEIKAHSLMGDMFTNFLRESVCKAVEALNKAFSVVIQP